MNYSQIIQEHFQEELKRLNFNIFFQQENIVPEIIKSIELFLNRYEKSIEKPQKED